MPDEFEVFRGTGDKRAGAADVLPARPPRFWERGRYIPSPALREAVNVALWVGQPLLVTGEPGVGKTTLARAVAHELDLAGPFEFHTRSTSIGRDLLYRYDAVRHFADIQRGAPSAADTAEYVVHEALGDALRAKDRRAVVLIDEIDKAPRDFPNDLLNELDRMKHTIAETREELEAKLWPVVIVTSNEERALPLPFLRRCVVHHIELPDRKTLCEIVASRLEGLGVPAALREAAVDKTIEIRKLSKLTKRPSIGEMLVWTWALFKRGIAGEALRETATSELPLLGALLKSHDDIRLVQRAG